MRQVVLAKPYAIGVVSEAESTLRTLIQRFDVTHFECLADVRRVDVVAVFKHDAEAEQWIKDCAKLGWTAL